MHGVTMKWRAGVRGAALIALTVVTLALIAAGCAEQMRRRSLERVAKDWCETIRASQVIPVYPLTEDLRPGDVFLVETPTATEAMRYRQRGFLPLDDFRERLDLPPLAYQRMYFDGYWKDEYGGIPHPRPVRTPGMFPGQRGATGAAGERGVTGSTGATGVTGSTGATGAAGSTSGAGSSGNTGTGESSDLPPKVGTTTGARVAGVPPYDPAVLLSQAKAPRAAFPSYTFDVSASQGLGLALPIQSVPVALGFLRAERATGTVTIADARTYGADPSVVLAKLREWAAREDIRPTLAAAAKGNKTPVFLRVITRVYLTGAVNVSLTRRSATGGDLAAGQAPKVSLVNEAGEVDPNYTRIIDAANVSAGAPGATGSTGEVGATGATGSTGVTGATGTGTTLPVDVPTIGGRFRFVSLSSSTVSLVEMFDTLLVIGYVGFDVPVYEDGSIGDPIPTFQKLESLVYPPERRRADEARYLQQIDLVQSGTGTGNILTRTRLAETMAAVSRRLANDGFNEVVPKAEHAVESLKRLERADATAQDHEAADRAMTEAGNAFRRAANRFIGPDGDVQRPARTLRFSQIFDEEFDRTRPKR